MSRTWFIALSIAWTVTAAPAQPGPAALPAGVTRVGTVEGITEYRLANGLQVLLVPDDSKPTTTVNVTYRVGSRHENYGETGMAHLLEHMVFKGTPTTRNALAEFSRRGLRPNGSTSYDRTNYFASFTANDETLRWYLGWQADIMVNCLIARSDLDSEMTVVRNEFEAGENNPGGVLMQKVFAGMYQWHNYGKSTIGARSDIENVDIPRLQAFYRQYYQPDNATLIVSGKFSRDLVLQAIAQSFAPIPRPQRVIAPTYTLDPPQDGERQVTVRRVGGAPLVFMAYHAPAGGHPDFAAIHLLSSVLGDTPGGRLHKRLVETQVAAEAFSLAWARAEPSPLIFGIALAPGQDIARARAAMAAVLDAVATEPLTAEELERARVGWINNWEQGFADPERVGVALSEAIALGDWRLYFLQRDQVRKLGLDDLNRVARQWLKPDNRTVGLFQPTDKPDRAPPAEKVDVAALVNGYRGDATAAQVEAFEPTPANLDARTRSAALRSGLKTALLPKGSRGGVVQARLRLRYGDEKSLFGLEVPASFVAALLDKGAVGMTRQQIADTFDRLQATVSFNADGQMMSVAVSTRRDRLPAVIELLGRLLRQPSFAADALEEVRRQWLAGIEQDRKEPESVVGNLLARHGNPYPRGDLRHAPTFDELEADVKAVTLAQVKSFHERFYSAAQGEFAAVGDLDPEAVSKALQAAFGDWSRPAAGAMPFRRVPRPLLAAAPARLVAATPDKANANLAGRLPLPMSDRHADYAAMVMANHLFGASGNSRLWKRIRETEGLSYDVRSGVEWSPLDEHSPWVFSAIFAPQNQARVEAAFRQELDRSLKDGFTQAELEENRVGLLNLRRLSRAQDNVVVGQLATNQYLDRRFALSQQVDDALSRLTLEQVNAAWRRHIDPQRLVWAWGGDFK